MTLKYTGGGYGGSLHGIPARDLTDDELAALPMTDQELVKSGLYQRAKSEDKMTRRKGEDKSAGEGEG